MIWNGCKGWWGNLCFSEGETHARSLLGSANLVRPGLRPHGPSNSASRHRLQRPQPQGYGPSQVADGHPNSPLGGGNEQAWKEHHMISCSPNAHAEWERKDTHIAPVLPECARGKRKDEGCWPLVLAQRARMVKLIVTLWAVLVEARSKRPISLVA
jgi:hypothetical protein